MRSGDLRGEHTTSFLPKLNKLFLSPILHNLNEGKYVLDDLKKIILSTSRKRYSLVKQKVLLQEDFKNGKW